MIKYLKKIIAFMVIIMIFMGTQQTYIHGESIIPVPASLFINETLINKDFSPMLVDNAVLLPTRVFTQFMGYYAYYNSEYQELKITNIDLSKVSSVSAAPALPVKDTKGITKLETEANIEESIEITIEKYKDEILKKAPEYLPTFVENKAHITIIMHIGDNTAYLNGKPIKLEAVPMIIDGKSYVPSQFVTEQLGCTSQWDPTYFALKLSNPTISVPKNLTRNLNYTMDEFYLLSKLIEVESANQVIECRIGVASVVINRVNSPAFPNTIEGVIYDQRWSVQFPPVFKEKFTTTVPSLKSRMAAKIALEGYNNIGNCLYYNHIVFPTKEVVYKIGGMFFMR